MAEKIDWQAEDAKHSTLAWELIEIIARAAKEDADAISAATRAGLSMVVEMRINGREVPFSTLLERLMVNFDAQVDARAKEILNEKVGDVVQMLNRIGDGVAEIFKKREW